MLPRRAAETFHPVPTAPMSALVVAAGATAPRRSGPAAAADGAPGEWLQQLWMSRYEDLLSCVRPASFDFICLPYFFFACFARHFPLPCSQSWTRVTLKCLIAWICRPLCGAVAAVAAAAAAAAAQMVVVLVAAAWATVDVAAERVGGEPEVPRVTRTCTGNFSLRLVEPCFVLSCFFGLRRGAT